MILNKDGTSILKHRKLCREGGRGREERWEGSEMIGDKMKTEDTPVEKNRRRILVLVRHKLKDKTE